LLPYQKHFFCDIFEGKDIGYNIISFFLAVIEDMILYHFFGRDRGYDIISSKKDMPMSGISLKR
jgi:hypothetical protein